MEFGQVHKASSAPQKQALYLCISKQAHRISLLYNFLLTRYLPLNNTHVKVGSDQIKCMPCIWIIAAIIAP